MLNPAQPTASRIGAATSNSRASIANKFSVGRSYGSLRPWDAAKGRLDQIRSNPLASASLKTRAIRAAGVGLGQGAVAAGVGPLLGRIGGTDLPTVQGGHTGHQGAGGHITGDHRTGRHQGPFPHGDTVEHYRTDADQAAVAQGGAMDHGPVPHGHFGTDAHRLTRITVEHGTVLDVAGLPHMDGADITAGDGCGPEAGARFEGHITDDDRAGRDPGLGVDGGRGPGSWGHVSGAGSPILGVIGSKVAYLAGR